MLSVLFYVENNNNVRDNNNLECSAPLTGTVSMDEFIKGAQQDPWVLSMLRLDMNPTGWLMAQRRKSAYF